MLTTCYARVNKKRERGPKKHLFMSISSSTVTSIKTLPHLPQRYLLSHTLNKALLWILSNHHHHHQSLNREGRCGITDDFATSLLHFSLFSTSLWDLPNSRPVHFLMLSSNLFLCPPCLLPPFTVPCKMVLARPDQRETWQYRCSLRHGAIHIKVISFWFSTGVTCLPLSSSSSSSHLSSVSLLG